MQGTHNSCVTAAKGRLPGYYQASCTRLASTHLHLACNCYKLACCNQCQSLPGHGPEQQPPRTNSNHHDDKARQPIAAAGLQSIYQTRSSSFNEHSKSRERLRAAESPLRGRALQSNRPATCHASTSAEQSNGRRMNAHPICSRELELTHCVSTLPTATSTGQQLQDQTSPDLAQRYASCRSLLPDSGTFGAAKKSDASCEARHNGALAASAIEHI